MYFLFTEFVNIVNLSKRNSPTLPICLISDRDSKSYIDVFGIYGICKQCIDNKQKFTNIADASFSEWVKSESCTDWCESHIDNPSCKVVFKRDCINHIAKNFRKDLESLSKSGLKVEGLKSITRSKNGLGQMAITRLGKRYRQVLFEGKLAPNSSEVEIARGVGRLRTSLFAVLYHSTCIEDPASRHQFCPEGKDSWCPYRRGVEWDGKKGHHLSPLLFPHVEIIFRKRTTDNYLRRVILGYNQNALESLNQLVWLNTPKHKFHGFKRVYIAAALAMLQFESGPSAYMAIQNHLGLPPSSEQTDEKMAQTAKTRVFHAQKKLKKAKKLFDDKADAAKSVPAAAEKDGYIPGGCEFPGPSGLNDLPQVHIFEGSFVAVANPGGLEVALCTEDMGPESPTVTVSYYEKSSVGDYFTIYDPPYNEKSTGRDRILMKLSHPTPKGIRTVRELSMLKFLGTELDAARVVYRNNFR